jgi:hypothetical protein
MLNYGLLETLDNPLILSGLAREICEATDPLGVFAAHMLTECHGLELVHLAQAVRRRDGVATNSAVLDELRACGYQTSTGTTDHTKMRQWLEAAGVVKFDRTGGWVVNSTRLDELVGVQDGDVVLWGSLTPPQQAVVTILRMREFGNRTPIPVRELLELLRQHGVEFNEKQVAGQVTRPLVERGLIRHIIERAGGQGSKSGTVELTPKGKHLQIELIGGLELGVVPADLQVGLHKRTREILDELYSANKGVKGTALELLALRMSADLGLIPADMRLRSSQTGGAEVDLVAEGAHLHFSRWLIQCKNTPSGTVDLGVLAKELGMATLLRAHVVVIVTTGSFATTVRAFARQAAESTAVQVVLIDAKTLKRYRDSGVGGLRQELHHFAREALVRKRKQLGGGVIASKQRPGEGAWSGEVAGGWDSAEVDRGGSGGDRARAEGWVDVEAYRGRDRSGRVGHLA